MAKLKGIVFRIKEPFATDWIQCGSTNKMIDSQSQKISNMKYIVFYSLSLKILWYACCKLISSILKNLTLFDIIIKIRLWSINFSGWMPFVYSRQINCTCRYVKQYTSVYSGLSRARLPISWQQHKIIKVQKAITKLQLMCRPWWVQWSLLHEHYYPRNMNK